MAGLCRFKKTSQGVRLRVPDVVKQKSAFQHTWFSNNKGFCLEIKSCHPLIHLKFCQETLSGF